MSKTIVDPPNGWLYGFPMELKEGVEFVDLLRENGYPEEDLGLALAYSRWWEQPDD